MGYASRARGTFEQRKAAAIEKQIEKDKIEQARLVEKERQQQAEWDALTPEQKREHSEFTGMINGVLSNLFYYRKR